MTNEELNTAVYQKLYAEQDAFRNQLLAMPPEEILSHAYEYVQREDLLLSLEYPNGWIYGWRNTPLTKNGPR